MADFNETQIQAVWDKGKIVENFNSKKYRKDMAGAWMVRDQYGKKGDFGWSIDHVYPEALGGDETQINLRPMQWQNNQSKSYNYPEYETEITSKGKENVEKEQTFTVNKNLQKSLKKLYNLK
ncbi:hypothetical protein [Ekhidna sp.]|jgi:hypothetical protein|uniref:hypothetical protein n=1 Tax=Ekhidna sp. TaxID=2608089 RepID=UPI0032EC1809